MNTKTLLKMLLPALALAVLCGCYTLSIHPLYDEEHLTLEPNIVGVWGNSENSAETWEFQKNGENAYRLIVREEGLKETGKEPAKVELVTTVDSTKDGVFEAHLVKLGKYLFMDLYPEEPLLGNELTKSMVIPTHMFFRITLKGDTLELGMFDLEQFMKENNQVLPLKHETVDGIKLLTASTGELQAFMLKHVDKAFFDEEIAYRLK